MRDTWDFAASEERRGLGGRDGEHHTLVPPREREVQYAVLCSVAECNVSPLEGRFCKAHTPRFETDPDALPEVDVRLRRKEARAFEGPAGEKYMREESQKRPYDLEFIGQRLREERVKLGHTRTHVAASVGIDIRTLGRVESGESTFLSTFLALLRFYDLPPSEVLRRVP